MALSKSYNIPELISKQDIELDTTHPDYDKQKPNYDTLKDCYDGGGCIEDAAEDKYLIKKSDESSTDYTSRKKRAKYYNKCSQIISTYQGHLWRKSPIRTLPDFLQPFLYNIDRENSTANNFFKYITEMAQVYGVYYVLIEYPDSQDYNIITTKEDEMKLNLRPYVVPISPINIIDWSFSLNNGIQSLQYIVIKEEVIIQKQPFSKAITENRYRIIYPNRQEIYVYNDKKEPQLISVKLITLNEIPLVPFYSKKINNFVGRSVLHDICGLNLELYNKHSDRDTSEFWTAHPVPFFKMFQPSDIQIGPYSGIFNMDPNSDFRLVEFSGSSIKGLRESEQDIMAQIFDLAMKQVKPSSIQRQTVESKRFDRLDSLSELQSRAIEFASSEELCWKYFAKWLKQDTEDISIIYNLDYNIQEMQSEMINTLLNLSINNVITKETLLNILQEGEIFNDKFSVEEEINKLNKNNSGKD